MRSWLGTVGRGIGFAAVVGTLVLSWSGLHAVRADEPAPQVSEAPPDNSSFEGFSSHLARKGRPVPTENAGATCNAQSPIAVEMAHQQAIAEMQARLIAEARARAVEEGVSMDVVPLNGSGYNYRTPQQGERLVPPPSPPPTN